MTGTEFLPLVLDAFNAVLPHYRDKLGPAHQELGFEGFDGVIVRWTGVFDPAPLDIAKCLAFNEYEPPEVFSSLFNGAAERGFLAQVSDGAYRLTDKGRKAMLRDRQEKLALLAAADVPLSDTELARLSALLQRVVDSVEAAAEPKHKPALTFNRKLDPGDSAHALARVHHYLLDLLRFRDDVHYSAWKPLGVSGALWETFSYLWEGRDMNAVLDRIENQREYPPGTVARLLEELAERGWGEQDGETYRITPKGDKLRRQAEETTNQCFDQAWDCLDDDESEELAGLLRKLGG